ncbi:hypothetical protein CEXT_569871 [Caerostris extrusa]|uniref:Uncharacterized protein n=1 Tax=Caerostris extrusa TaxID=172846 RepID=A0AAV4VX03_CAEEX|nr:hypothetical protein CEXT_569871 [Caerostris extrusa]
MTAFLHTTTAPSPELFVVSSPQVLEMSFQDITPTLAKLRIGIRDLLKLLNTFCVVSHSQEVQPAQGEEGGSEGPGEGAGAATQQPSVRRPGVERPQTRPHHREAYLPRADKWFYIPQKTFIKR